MVKQIAWTLGIIGLALLIIGLVSVTAPNMTVPTLMLYFGVMLLIIGGVQAATSLMLRKKLNYWPWLLFASLLFAGAGYYMIKHVDEAASKFKLVMAFWAMLVGIIQLGLSIRQKATRIFLISMGAISLFFGSLIFMNPFSGPNTVQFMVGFYTLLLSFFILYISFRMLTRKKTSPA